jgi:Cu/Ag efflux protein CusF
VKTTSVVLGVILLFAASSVSVKAAWAHSTRVEQGVDAVEVIKDTATVEKIDLEKRKITLLLDTGKRKTFKVDKSVQNLDQVRVGDHLSLAYTEEIIILVGKSSESPGAASTGEVAVAPQGAKPGVVMTETSALSAKILAVDTQKHRLTFLDPDGKKKTIKLSKNVTNLDQLKVGETVDMLLSESLVVEILK